MTDETPESPKPSVGIRFVQSLQAHMAVRNQRFHENLTRVASLMNASAATKGKDAGADILRSAVVFLHASLEDFLRGLAESYLPLAGEAALNKVPIAGKKKSAEFQLGRLAIHRGKTVDQVIVESVNKSLRRSSYNNAREISRLLNDLNIPFAHVKPQLKSIEAMMRRRHQIVHRADRVRSKKRESIEAIDHDQVFQWLTECMLFVSQLVINVAFEDMRLGRRDAASVGLVREYENSRQRAHAARLAAARVTIAEPGIPDPE